MASRQLAHLGGKQCRDEDRNAPLPMGFAFRYSDAYNITYVFQGGVFDPANLPAWFVRVLDPRRDGCCETTSALYRHLCIIGSSHGMRNEMHLSTKDLQITLRCIHLISGKAAPSPHCHQISAVNNPAASADSCKAVISLRNPWALLIQHWLIVLFAWHDPQRSLVKLAQVVRDTAWLLMEALAEHRRVGEAFALIERRMRSGCQMNTRGKRPNSAQLLQRQAVEWALSW